MKFEQIRKPLLFSCLIASVGLHFGAFYYFYEHPLSVEHSEDSKWAIQKTLPEAMPILQEDLKAERIEQVLEQSLNQIVTTDIPIEEQSPIAVKSPQKQLPDSMPPLFNPEISASISDFAVEDEGELAPFDYQIEKYASLDLIEPFLQTGLPPSILNPDPVEDDEEISTLAADSPQIEEKAELQIHNSDTKKLHTEASLDQPVAMQPFTEISESTTPRLVLPNTVDYLREEWLKRSLASRTLPEADHYGIEDSTKAIDWQENIDVDITYMRDPDTNRYIFSATLHPGSDLTAETIPQHFYFIIDRTVDKQKFGRNKRAVQRALSALNEGDAFNIIVFDKRLEKFSEQEVIVRSNAIEKAEDYLEKLEDKPSRTGESFKSIESLLPTHLHDDEIYSVILITDGHSFLTDTKQKKAFNEWAKKNHSSVNIYTAASGQENNLALLDFMSYVTGGKFLYSETNSSFPRKLVKFVKDMHDPIVKNVIADAVASDGNTRVELAGRGKASLPPLFAGRPYTLVGSIDDLCDFTLFIQGKRGERYLNIKKEISLKNGTQGGRTLAKIWAGAQATEHYDRFLDSGNISHLQGAKELIGP